MSEIMDFIDGKCDTSYIFMSNDEIFKCANVLYKELHKQKGKKKDRILLDKFIQIMTCCAIIANKNCKEKKIIDKISEIISLLHSEKTLRKAQLRILRKISLLCY